MNRISRLATVQALLVMLVLASCAPPPWVTVETQPTAGQPSPSDRPTAAGTPDVAEERTSTATIALASPTTSSAPSASPASSASIAEGSPPPITGQIVFLCSRDNDNADICVMNTDGTGLRNLTNSPEPEGFPIWSPDGTRIAFASLGNEGNDSQISVMKADGTELINLTKNQGKNGVYSPWAWRTETQEDPAFADFAWSPDSTRIAFSSTRDGNPEIYVVNVDGTKLNRLTIDPEVDSNPTWSPNGDKIAFSSSRGGDNTDIYVMNDDGTGLVNLTQSPKLDVLPAWSPDGKKLAFVSNRDGMTKLYIMNTDGTQQTPLVNMRADTSLPIWSPSSDKIAFITADDDNYSAFFDDDELQVVNVDGTGLTRLTNNPMDGSNIRWSPNGEKLVFASDRDNTPNIYVINANGTGLVNLTNNSLFSAYPDWSMVRP